MKHFNGCNPVTRGEYLSFSLQRDIVQIVRDAIQSTQQSQRSGQPETPYRLTIVAFHYDVRHLLDGFGNSINVEFLIFGLHRNRDEWIPGGRDQRHNVRHFRLSKWYPMAELMVTASHLANSGTLYFVPEDRFQNRIGIGIGFIQQMMSDKRLVYLHLHRGGASLVIDREVLQGLDAIRRLTHDHERTAVTCLGLDMRVLTDQGDLLFRRWGHLFRPCILESGLLRIHVKGHIPCAVPATATSISALRGAIDPRVHGPEELGLTVVADYPISESVIIKLWWLRNIFQGRLIAICDASTAASILQIHGIRASIHRGESVTQLLLRHGPLLLGELTGEQLQSHCSLRNGEDAIRAEGDRWLLLNRNLKCATLGRGLDPFRESARRELARALNARYIPGRPDPKIDWRISAFPLAIRVDFALWGSPLEVSTLKIGPVEMDRRRKLVQFTEDMVRQLKEAHINCRSASDLSPIDGCDVLITFGLECHNRRLPIRDSGTGNGTMYLIVQPDASFDCSRFPRDRTIIVAHQRKTTYPTFIVGKRFNLMDLFLEHPGLMSRNWNGAI